MKKITILLSVSLLLASITSCIKESVNQPGNSNVVPTPPSAPSGEVKIASSWFTLSLDPVNNRANAYLIGRHAFETKDEYDKLKHVELAYVSIPGQRTIEYKRLPLKYIFPQSTQDKMCSLSSSMNMTGFILTISNLKQPNEFPDASDFADFRYRYIVIPKTLYDSFSIDWDDYEAVAFALNI